MTITEYDWIQKRRQLTERFKARVAKSVTSAAADGSTVERPEQAAEYVTNALLRYPDGQELLAACAVFFARSQVERMLSNRSASSAPEVISRGAEEASTYEPSTKADT